MNPNQMQFFDAPRPQTLESEEEIFSRIVSPEGRTSYKETYEYDDERKKIVKKARNLGVPELNIADVTTGIFAGKNSEFAFVWHTAVLINQLVYIQQESGYDLSNLIQFHYANYTTNANLSKGVGGALLKALTTKEMKQIQEHRVIDPNKKDGGQNKLNTFLERLDYS